MHKVLIVANNQKWKSWDAKIQELHDWFKGIIKVDLIHTQFRNIPFVQFDTNKYEIDRAWYDTNIHPLSMGYDIVLLSLPTREWKGKGITGRWTHDNLIEEIQIGANETGTYYFGNKKFPGGRWFNLARHEISHALYKIFKAQDKTHFWWETGSFESSRDELLMLYNKSMETKPSWKYFKEKEVIGLSRELVDKLDMARGIAGIPFVINSGYRTVEKNEDVGGVEGSSHIKGLAVDIKCSDSIARMKIVSSALQAGFRRIGIGKTFVHLDIDTTKPQDVIWNYY